MTVNYDEGRTGRALRRAADVVDKAARKMSYRGGERSPRFLLERLSDYLVFTAIFRAWSSSSAPPRGEEPS